MRVLFPLMTSAAWTAVLLILFRMPVGARGTDWRLPLFLLISWVLGLVLIAWVTLGRERDPRKGVIITVDEATGLANRRAFQGHVEPLLKAAVRFAEKSLVVILNINNLDRIIEEDSDEEAEQVVMHMAQAFMDSLRGSDILARYDKDELIAFLPKASMFFTDRVTDRIMMNVAAQRRHMESHHEIKVSVGYAEFDPVAPQSLDYLIRQAYKDMIRFMGEAGADAEEEPEAPVPEPDSGTEAES